MRIVHLITHLRLGAGRAIVDLAVHQASHRGHDVLVVVADDAEGGWRSDPAMLEELRASGVGVHTAGDFFHRDPVLLDAAAVRLRDPCRTVGRPDGRAQPYRAGDRRGPLVWARDASLRPAMDGASIVLLNTRCRTHSPSRSRMRSSLRRRTGPSGSLPCPAILTSR